MSYTERYYHVFCDKFSNTYRASILERDFAGAAELVNAGPSPVVISYESFSDFKFDTIRASRCVLTLISAPGFGTQDFYTGDEKKFKVEVRKNGSLYWVGYMTPNGIKEDFRSPPSYITITATDYLPGIKNIKYLQPDGNQYRGRYTFLDVLNQCLTKTDLGLGMDTYVNLYPTALTPSPIADPLNETDVNVQTFIEDRNRALPDRPGAGQYPRPRDKYPSQTANSDKVRPMNCYEVLSYNATLWQSRLFQEDARWKFERINNKFLQNTIRRYDPSGTLIGTTPHPAPRKVSCTDNTVKLVGGAHTLAMDRVFKRVTVEYKHAFGDTHNNVTQFLRNGDFEDYVPVGQWNYWRGTPGVVPVHVQIGSDTGIAISNFSRKNLYVESWPIQVTEGDEIDLEIRLRLSPESTANRTLFGLFQVYAEGTFNFNTGSRPRLSNASDRVAYLCTEETRAEWHGSPIWIAIPLTPAQKGQMITRRFSSAPMPGSGKLKVRLFGTADMEYGLNGPGGRDDTFLITPDGEVSILGAYTGGDVLEGAVSSTFGVVECYHIRVGKKSAVNEESFEIPFTEEQHGNFTDEPEIITIINADDQNPEHISDIQIHDGALKTSLWTVDGQPEYLPKPIGNVVARSVLEQYKQPYHIIEGDIRGPDLKFSDVYAFDMPGVKDELFMVQRGSFDLIRSTVVGTFVQITDDVVESDGTINGNDITPNWARTGWQRCIRGADGKTTGETEAEEGDFNPYSATYNQKRWINIGNIGGCGGNDYYEYLWGGSGETLDTDDLQNWQFSEGADQVTVWFTSSGKWLWFLHRPEAGTVVSILDIENEETIFSWEYQPDKTIEGVTFKAMRMAYKTGTFNHLPKTFVFG